MERPIEMTKRGLLVIRCTTIFLLAIGASQRAFAASISPVRLRCDLVAKPLGLRQQHPSLAWHLAAAQPGQFALRQSAYQILVASTRAQLNAGHGNLWDTGKIKSGKHFQIRYSGQTLAAGGRCWWKVRIWGKAGHPSPWSKPAFWSVGLLHKNNWLAHWIKAPPNRISDIMHRLSWCWLPGVGTNAPVGSVYFRKTIHLPRDQKITKAVFYLTADNEFQLFVNGTLAGSGLHWRLMQQVKIAPLLHPGRNILAVKATNGGTSPNPAGLLGILRITYANGYTHDVPVDNSWKISNRPAHGWKSLRLNNAAHWAPASPIARWGAGPWGRIEFPIGGLPLFRKAFDLGKPIAHAVVYVSGLGQYELFINGRQVSHDLMQPAWTDYRKLVAFNTSSVTSMLQPGRNALAIMLGTGMYDSARYTGRYNHAPASFGPPKLILQLHITFKDGTSQTIVSNASWRTAPGPITFCNIFGGEDYNALDAVPGWKLPQFNAHHWQHAVETHGPGGRLVAQKAPPVKIMRIYKAIRIGTPAPNATVYDLGQNIAGRPVITARGPAGATLTVFPAELIHPNDSAWQSCAGPIWCTYTLNGKGVETFHPLFSYYGFRYVQVNAAPPPGSDHVPTILGVVGEATHTSAPVVGHFSCSNKLINKINHLITMAMANNMMTIITDCPTREKTGWLEETYLVGPGIMDNFGAANLYRQTAANMRSDQLANGLVQDIAPVYFHYAGGFADSPEWGAAAIMDPWLVYRFDDDKQILSKNYPMMMRYLHYLQMRSSDGLLTFGLGDWYDLGPNPPGYEQLTTLGVTATATWYQDLTVMEKISRLLGHSRAAATYAAVARRVRAAFNQRFYHPATGQYDRGSQCANAMALVTGLVHRADRKRVLANLIANIKANGDHTTAGDIGFHYVVQALTDAHQSALLYKLATRTTPPSYGYQIAQGATSLTESWNALPQDSQDHFMLGHIEQWFYNGLAGIHLNFARKAGHQLVIRPAMPGHLQWVHASYNSVFGKIVSRWKRSGGRCLMTIRIPIGAVATVYIPHRGPSPVLVNGVPIGRFAAIKLRKPHRGHVVCRVPSGLYHFISQDK